jgi:hypothetical protein
LFGSEYTFRSRVEISLVWGARFLPLARAVFGSSCLFSTVSVLLGATNFLQSTSFGSGLSLVLPTVWLCLRRAFIGSLFGLFESCSPSWLTATPIAPNSSVPSSLMRAVRSPRDNRLPSATTDRARKWEGERGERKHGGGGDADDPPSQCTHWRKHFEAEGLVV